MKITFCAGGLNIGGKIEPVYCASVHYWRLDYKLWNKILDNVKKLGFKMIETYIPWQIHELEKGIFDFGEIDKNKDIKLFLELCQSKSIKVIVRPGPHINAEMTYFGYPKRIVLDPEIQALTSFGTPYIMPHFIKQFPVPSYASNKFYEEVAIYFDALAPLLKDKIYPNGPIIAIQSDNETSYFFMLGPYILDYSKDSLSLYKTFLKEKYNRIEELNLKYGTHFESFNDITPPTGFTAKTTKELPYFFDWCEYKEYQIIYANRKIAKMWKDRGIDLPTFHNMPADEQYYLTPYDPSLLEESKFINLVGIDCYNTKEEFKEIKNRVRFMNGTSVLPFIPEFGSGSWCWRETTLSPDEEEFIYLYAYMYGLKAANFYMVVERERWQGSPITRTNRKRGEFYSLFAKLGRFLADSKLEQMERIREIVIIRDYDLGRLKMLSVIANFPKLPGLDIPPELFTARVDLGFKYLHKGGFSEETWVRHMDQLLEGEKIDFDYANSHISLNKLNKYKVAILPTFDFIDREITAKFLQYVQQGGVLIIGPGIPYLDSNMKTYHAFAKFDLDNNSPVTKYGDGRIIFLKKPNSVLDFIRELNIRSEFMGHGVEVTSFYSPTGRKLVFAANPNKQMIRANIRFSGERFFKALINCNDIKGRDSIVFNIKGYTVCAWEVFDNAVVKRGYNRS